jgi:lipopolysaccharide export system protein LptA
MQRIVIAIASAAVLALFAPPVSFAQIKAGNAVTGSTTPDVPGEFGRIEPVLPPGISDFNLEFFGRLAYTWTDPDGTKVIEVQGNFEGRMGQYLLKSRQGVAWFRNKKWQDKTYLEVEIFLWQDAEIHQPAGTLDSGPALLVTLRTFGQLVLNADAHSPTSDADSELYREGSKVRKLLVAAPPEMAEECATPIQIAQSPEKLRLQRPRIAKKVDFTAEKLTYEQHDKQSVVIAIGDVFVSQGSPAQSGEYVEIRADAAVVYMNQEQIDKTVPGFVDRPDSKEAKKEPPAPERGAPRIDEKKGRDDVRAAREWAEAVYLEGDVVLTRGQRMIRAERIYYDFEQEKALILDVVTRAVEPTRSLPIYVRAEEVRQLSATEYEAEKAQFTTSEFYTPHVAIGADKVVLIDRTPKNEAGDVIGVEAGTYKAYHTTFNLEGLPIAYWPYSRGDFSRDRMAFRSAKIGYNGDFGATFETRWYLFNLMGLETPEGYDATLKLDYFTDRGPATGIDMDYEREDYMGLLRTYYINDGGEDDFGGARGNIPPDHDNRGRALWRHRQFLPKDWELNLEAAYLSDDNFLESYERGEFENGKEQETDIYLVKRQDNWQFSTLANWRIYDFLTQTEHLPVGRFTLIGEPLGEFATAYSDSNLGVVRYRPDDQRFWNGQDRRDNTGETGSVVRGDTREELTFPLPDFGPVKLTPYVAGRASAWDDGPSGWYDSNSGGLSRAFGSYGLRGNMVLSKVDECIESSLLDLHRLRHIIKPDFAVWNAHSNQNPDDLTPFDSGIEDIDDFGGGTVGVRQKFQTQRGRAGEYRTVDWIVFDMEAGFFSNKEKSENVPNVVYGKHDRPIRAFNPDVKSNVSHGDYIYSRPEDSISSNFLATNFQYRLSDSTVLIHDNVFDANRGNMGTSNVSLAVEREPRLAYFVGWRYIHDTASNIIAFGGNYKLSEKHTVAIRELYDIDQGRNVSTELVYVRRWPRWYSAVTLDVDKTLDDVGINLSVWPEGAPNLGLGSKRYTGLGDSVGLNVR